MGKLTRHAQVANINVDGSAREVVVIHSISAVFFSLVTKSLAAGEDCI